MPISLTFTEDTLSQTDAQQAGRLITSLFLRHHELSDNAVMGPGVSCHINFLPRAQALSNGEPFDGAWIETRTPSFALSDRGQQRAFFNESIEVILRLSQGRLERNNIFGSSVYTVEGTWILQGKPMTNQEVGAAVARG